MISDAQLQSWKEQSKKDMQQFKKDQQSMKQLYGDSKSSAKMFFEKLRAKYIHLQSQQNDKLARLLTYTGMEKQMHHYKDIVQSYITYNTCFIITLATCLIAPKKIISKVISSIVVYGLKKNVCLVLAQITDGLFTFYMVEKMAISDRFVKQEQELRNVLQFYYMHKFFTKSIGSDQQRKQATEILEKIKKMNQKYENYKKVNQIV